MAGWKVLFAADDQYRVRGGGHTAPIGLQPGSVLEMHPASSHLPCFSTSRCGDTTCHFADSLAEAAHWMGDLRVLTERHGV